MKQRYRKLALATPQQRLLPDINSGRNGPSSLSPSRSNSRAPSRNIRSYDDRRMSTAPEEDESTHR
ncbi:unnamed protein product [Candidula unifasciata]|uniref:Uncharacterized protein n=1 Tax=Candidula unifasciata TaxID=100452 RepID=A0A8S3ZAF3_9EUPU|nr:unnamed protein product [Candidula unifasciata]